MRRVLILMTLALLFVSAMAFGQAQRGVVEVTVTDTNGQALPGATVNVTSEQTLTRRDVFTDDSGKATAVALDPAANYVVTVTMDGFSSSRVNGVVVNAGSTSNIAVKLGIEEVSDELIVTAEAPLVDVTKTQAGQNITLQLTESLPTARSYQDFLQLVPGVQATITDNGASGNPASRSGVNYRDVLGEAGRSTDNLYYFDGINVTDRTAGTFGANMNTEIIQEQSVLTGAIPAEYVGAPGLISNVVTKSGGNDFSGSVNYYFQDDNLVDSNDHFADESFSTFDTAFTLGGPIWKDKAWFYASYRLLEREQDVVNEDGEYLRTPTREADQAFGKLTWAITDSDVFSGVFLSDPQDQDGSFNRQVPNGADIITEQGGERFTIGYNRVWGPAAIELGYSDHEGDLNSFPINRQSESVVSFRPGSVFTSGEEEIGGAGNDFFDTRSNDSLRGSVEFLFDTGIGDHSVKLGFDSGESSLFEEDSTVGDPPATWISISARELGNTITLNEMIGTGDLDPFTTNNFGISPDDFQGFRRELSPGTAATLLGLWDDDHDGALSDAEITNHMVFASTAGNPDGQINYTRDLQVSEGSRTMASEYDQYYIQDSWQWNRLSVNAGVRAEQWDHFASNGDSISNFDLAVVPRVSVSYDVRGDGRSSVGLFYGEYSDAVRNNMTDFAGSLTGAVIHEQVWLEETQEFTTFRVRGGEDQQDGFFAPRIETPTTSEFQVQYKQDLGRNMMAEINYVNRETSDVLEDYGNLYYDDGVYRDDLGGDLNDPGSLFLGPQFFGWDSLDQIPTNLNFIIGTLPPEAFRDWQGIELIFRKRYSNNWQMLASYNWADGDANTNSDSNADGAGDVFFLDPRAPGRTGVQPGLVEHLFKLSGSYNWDNGFQVGGSYRWNSGVVLNRSGTQAFSRNLPDQVDQGFASNGLPGNGFVDTWISDDAVGYIDGSDNGSLDLRVSYLWALTDRIETDFFLDIFNLFDDQQTVRVQDLENGGGGFEFLEGMNFVQPRRYFLGARLRF